MVSPDDQKYMASMTMKLWYGDSVDYKRIDRVIAQFYDHPCDLRLVPDGKFVIIDLFGATLGIVDFNDPTPKLLPVQ